MDNWRNERIEQKKKSLSDTLHKCFRGKEGCREKEGEWEKYTTLRKRKKEKRE